MSPTSPSSSSSPSPFTTLRRLGTRVRRRLLIHRRLLAALCVGLAALVGVQAVAPAPPATDPVWTAARDLAAGQTVSGSDLVSTEFLPSSVPSGAVRDPRALIGRVLAAPVRRGEPLTALRLVGSGLMAGYPGRTAVPLRITDADTVGLLRVGDEISVVVADPERREPPAELVEGVPVIAIPRAGRSAAGTPGRLVVVAVPRSQAADVAARAATGILIPVWSR